MSGTQTFRVGQMVWDRGQNEFGDAKRGGMVVRVEADDDGETQVVVITQARPDPHDKRPCRDPGAQRHRRPRRRRRLDPGRPHRRWRC